MSNRVSRRRVLQSALVGGVALGLGRALSAADDSKSGFKLGIQSYTLRDFPIEKAWKAMHELGAESVELFEKHFSSGSSEEQIKATRKQAQELGIAVLGYGVVGFSKDHEANRRMFEFAKKAGIRNLSADPSEDSFDSLDKLVDEYDIRIAIHNHGPGARYNKVSDVLTAIEGHDKRIGACADLGHYIRSAEDPVRAINLFKGRLYGIHLKDFDKQQGDAKGVILGKGHLDVAGVFKALKAVEFPADGSLSLEYEENPQDPMADVKECFAIAREGMKKAGVA